MKRIKIILIALLALFCANEIRFACTPKIIIHFQKPCMNRISKYCEIYTELEYENEIPHGRIKEDNLGPGYLYSEKVVLTQTFYYRFRKSKGTCLIWRIYEGNYGSAKEFWQEKKQVKYVSRELYIDNSDGIPFYLHFYIGDDGKLVRAEKQNYPWSEPETCTENFQDSPSYL